MFKNGESLEELHRADTIIFDKTGTITEGKLSLQNVFVNDISETEFLSLITSIESQSEHPIARAIVEYAKEKNIKLISITEFENKPGKGIKGKSDDKIILAGNEFFMNENKIDLSFFKVELKKMRFKIHRLFFSPLTDI